MNQFAPTQPSERRTRRNGGACHAALTGVLWLGLLGAGAARAQTLQDVFADRVVFTNPSGDLSANNAGASVEANEPKHGGKPGGHSMWITWVAPADGIATFRTDGSTFDTLLSAYYFSPTNETTLDKLHEAARNDDGPGIAPASLLEFGALAGRRYEIAVDGFAGALGDIRLRWSFINATAPPPIVVSVSSDQAAKQGDAVTLSVSLQTSGAVQLRWQFNETELDEHGTNIFIPSLQPENVGIYKLRVTIGAVRFFTTPIELQINSDGETNALARDKLLDAPSSPLIGDDGSRSGFAGGRLALHSLAAGARPLAPLGLGVVRGYNGSQVFNTTYATADPAEPPHCGVPGGRSYWLLYQPPTNGTVTLDTLGSTYDTVVEAYTYNGALTGYPDLISLDCANDSFGTNGPSRVRFPVIHSRKYVIAVDGVGGAFGTAWLNYQLDTNQLPVAPTVTFPPPAQTVRAGSTVVLVAPVTGSAPLAFVWRKDGVLLDGETSPALTLVNVTSDQVSTYAFTASNDLGQADGAFVVRGVVPPRAQVAPAPGGIELSFPTLAGLAYLVEESTNLLSGWLPWPAPIVGEAGTKVITLDNQGTKFYRIRVQ